MNESTITKLDSMPEFLSSLDLVSLGLFRNPDATYLARLRGNSPDYIKVGRRIFYPKSRVIEFIASRIQNGSTPKNQ